MEFKKSRLEIDSNSSIPGTSSSSLSPGGLNTSTGGPYRGRYTRSSLGVTGSSTGSRFSPYSLGRDRTTTQRRSIPVIRATREDDSKSGYSLGFGGTSSTAQKIMNTLASMSTPVMNAGRVRIDSIKSVRPVQMTSPLSTFGGSVLSASSKFCGPPKTSSPLLLPKSPSGIRLDADKSSWSLKCLSIPPKMVDCGTNTDELPFIAEDNKNNVTMTSPKPARKVSVTVKEEGGGRLADLIGKFKCTNGDFKFDSPWALKEVDKYLGSNQHKKDLEKDTSTSQSSSSLESSESDAESERNIISKNKMPNGKHELDSSSKIKQEQTSYSKPFSSTSTTAKKWECPTCMVYNNESDKSCVCCQTLNPDAKSTPDKTDSAKSPKLATSSASAAAQWTCPTCMVPNKPTSASCVCCQETNPNPVEKSSASSSSPLAPTSSFKFGFSSTPIQSSSGGIKNSDGGFGCPKPSTDSSTDKTPFMFGFKTPTTTTTSGTSSSTSTSTNTSGFTFGAKSSSAASTPSFKFGINASDEEMLSKYPTIELWQCEVCPASNKMGLFSCVTCGSPRPHEFDAHYKKPEDKPKPDIKFQPVFKSSPGPTSTTAAAASGIFSVPTTTTATATSAFSNSNSFSSGNPFGGAGAFGSGTVGTGFGSLISTTPVTSTTTTQNSTTGGFGSFTSSTTNSGSASTFQFGMPSTETPKRKHEAGSVEGDVVKKPSQTFSFNTSSTPAPLKLKEVVSIQPQQLFTNTTVESDPPSVNNNAGFLQALKQASDAVKASNEKQPSIVPQPAKGFDFGASSSQSLPTFGSAAPSFTFGSSSTSMTPLPGQNTAPSMPSIGLAPAPQFNLTPNFNFGASTPAPASSTFAFGNTSGAAPSSTPFAFQANNSIAPQAQAGVPPPQPSPLFQFQSTPTPGGGGAEGRKIKRATRRFAPR